MEIEEMKNLWAGQPTEEKQKEALALMLTEKSHPILKNIRKQLLLEISSWLVILCVYYSMFDGQMRPWIANGVFIMSMVQAIAFNISGYLVARNLIHGDNLVTSLSGYLISLKRFKWTSLFSRMIFMGGMLFFFLYGLDMDIRRVLAVGFIVVVSAGQLWFLHSQWSLKIDKLTSLQTNLVDTNNR